MQRAYAALLDRWRAELPARGVPTATLRYEVMEWNGMEWNGMEWNGMEWNGMEWKM